MTETQQLAWMLIYLSTCIDYLRENHETAFEYCGLKQLYPDLCLLEPLIQKHKDKQT